MYKEQEEIHRIEKHIKDLNEGPYTLGTDPIIKAYINRLSEIKDRIFYDDFLKKLNDLLVLPNDKNKDVKFTAIKIDINNDLKKYVDYLKAK